MLGTDVIPQSIPQDTAHPSEQISTDSASPTKLYTEEEVRKAVAKAVTQEGRKRKAESPDLETIVQKVTNNLKGQFVSASEIEEFITTQSKGNPEGLSAWQKAQRDRQTKATEAQRIAEIEAREKKLTERERGIRRDELAKVLEGIELEEEDIEKMLDMPAEIMAKVVKSIKSKSEVTGETHLPDSGVTSGITGRLTNEQADDMPVEEYKARRKKDGANFR